MRILHVIDSLELGGAERMLVEIANSATADGHEVSACVTRSATTLASDLHPKIKLTTLNRSRQIDLHAMRRLAIERTRAGKFRAVVSELSAEERRRVKARPAE